MLTALGKLCHTGSPASLLQRTRKHEVDNKALTAKQRIGSQLTSNLTFLDSKCTVMYDEQSKQAKIFAEILAKILAKIFAKMWAKILASFEC